MLESKPLYDRVEEVLEVWTSDVEAVSGAINSIDETLSLLPTVVDLDVKMLPESATLEGIAAETNRFVTEAKKHVDALKELRSTFLSDDGEFLGSLGEHRQQWEKAATAFDMQYQEAKGRASAHTSQLAQLAQIEKRIAEMRASVAGIKKEAAALGKPQARYIETRKSWLAAKTSRAALVKAECEKLTQRSTGEIRATVRIGAGVEAVLEKFRASIAGSGIRRDKIDSMGESVTGAGSPDELWLQIVGELESLAAYDPEEGGEKNVPKCPVLNTCGFGAADLLRVASKLNEDAWLELSLTRLQDHPVFEFSAREGEYIPFTNASAGQQATALLKVLLNQPGPPLIIDQPEEDLDNPVILEVVAQIWRAKKERQLILSSHNANLVVNGDAELVAWCDYRTTGDHSGGQIREVGAIDIPAICGAIKQVMEGGEAAFKLRKEKYGF